MAVVSHYTQKYESGPAVALRIFATPLEYTENWAMRARSSHCTPLKANIVISYTRGGLCFHIHSFCHYCLCARGESHYMRAEYLMSIGHTQLAAVAHHGEEKAGIIINLSNAHM